jgi:hypothetical protein
MEINKITELVLENIESLLLEGRVEDVKKKYPSNMWDNVDQLVSIDPSGNNKYLDWMSKNYLPRTIKWFKDNADASSSSWYSYTIDQVPDTPEDPRWSEYNFTRYMSSFNTSDLLTLKDNIEHFHKNPSKYEIKDINQFPDKSSFEDAVEVAKQKLSRKEEKETGVDKVYEDDTFILMMPKTHKASCRYGSNTRWCVTMRDRSSYFENYFKQGPIFFLVDKRRTPASYSPAYMKDAPDYWKVAIHYRPFNGRLDQSGNRALQYTREMSKQEFVDGANAGNTQIDYWNVTDDKKPEKTVVKFLAGPGKGQTQRSEQILNTLKNVMETYTKKILSDYYDSVGGDKELMDEYNNLKIKLDELKNSDDSYYSKINRLSTINSQLIYFENQLKTGEEDDEYNNWVKEQIETSEKYSRQLNEKRSKVRTEIESVNSKIREIESKLSKNKLAFYDKEKSVSIS